MKWILSSALLLMSVSGFADFSSKINGEFVTLTGKVSDVKANSFMLKTDNNKILVEMDDYSSWVADGFKLVNGDHHDVFDPQTVSLERTVVFIASQDQNWVVFPAAKVNSIESLIADYHGHANGVPPEDA